MTLKKSPMLIIHSNELKLQMIEKKIIEACFFLLIIYDLSAVSLLTKKKHIYNLTGLTH